MSETDRTRLIEAEWQQPDTKEKEKYMAEIQVYANNRTGLLWIFLKYLQNVRSTCEVSTAVQASRRRQLFPASFELNKKNCVPDREDPS